MFLLRYPSRERKTKGKRWWKIIKKTRSADDFNTEKNERERDRGMAGRVIKRKRQKAADNNERVRERGEERECKKKSNDYGKDEKERED